MPANWIEICLSVPRDEAEAAEEALAALGALSITLEDDADDPVLEPGPGQTPLWPTVQLRGLFTGDAERDRILDGLQALNAAQRPGNLRFREVGDRDWTRAWMDRFQPMRFGRRLWIVPGGMAAPDAADAVVIHLDPGLAFGTGTHPTTALCLEWLDGWDGAQRTVVDYGCGSGILAIAAALLGARRVVAVDNDPQALRATVDNAARNAVAERVEVLAPEHYVPAEHDLVLANILAGPLIELAPRLVASAAPGGRIVLSGLLEEQLGDVAPAYRATCEEAGVAVADGWARLELVRRPAAR
ncbi:MAG: 50S ribosomal protein L11 methyltransferase [Xanthomonadales bacterium]